MHVVISFCHVDRVSGRERPSVSVARQVFRFANLGHSLSDCLRTTDGVANSAIRLSLVRVLGQPFENL